MRYPPKIPNTKEWKNVIEKEYKFHYITEYTDILPSSLLVTSCSKTKLVKKGYPKDLYHGKINKLFYKFVENNNLDYGIISDKYGLHMFDENLPYYDIHPSSLSYAQKKDLGAKIREKIKNYGYKDIIFYYPSPLLSKPYFEMLWYSKLSVYYLSTISLIERL